MNMSLFSSATMARNLLSKSLILRTSNRENAPIFKRLASNRTPLILMDLPRNVFPNVFQMIGLGLKMKLSMMKIDPSFKYIEFTKGAEQAMLHISNSISRGDFESLKGLVRDDSIETIKKNFAQLSAQQKEQIATRKEDIQMQTLHVFETVSIQNAATYVKIGMLFQMLPGISNMWENAKDPNALMEIAKRMQTDLIIADYQFIREYKNGQSSDWLVNELNHWSVADYLGESKN